MPKFWRKLIELTFDVQLDESRLAHAQAVLGRAAVDPGRVPGHRAEVDLLVGVEDAVEALLPPEDIGGGIAVRDAPEGGETGSVKNKLRQRALTPVCVHVTVRQSALFTSRQQGCQVRLG